MKSAGMFAAYIRFLHRWRWPLAVFFTTIFVFCAWQSLHLKLKSDFKELLPDNFQSVKDLNRIVERAGGTSTLIVAIESDDPQSSIRFGLDLIAKLKEYPPEFISRVEYNGSQLKKFYENNKYLFIDLDDLKDLHDRLDRRIQHEKLKATGLLIELETNEEKDKEFMTKDIEDKYRKKTSRYDDYIDGYFFGEKGKLMAIIIRPPGSATGVEFASALVNKVNKTITELDQKKYHPSMKVGLTGKFRRVLFEYQTLIDDIVSTALLVVLLVGLAVWLYFRKVRMVLLMAWTVFNGVAWTFAATFLKIGYLNTQTAFLGSIIVGNGINFGLILMARYLEERRQGHNPFDALQIAMPATFAPTLTASATSSVSFGILIMTQIKGFSHFGFIGGLGMFACWVATFTVLPVFLSLSEEIWPLVKKTEKRWFAFSPMTPFTKNLPKWSRNIVRGGIFCTVASALLLVYFIPRSLEYDFSKLRVKPKGQAVSEEQALNDRVRKIFSGSMSPAVLVADRMDQVVPLCDEITRKKNLDPEDIQVVDSCKSIYSHVPDNQEEKIEWLKKTKKLLNDSALNFLNEDQKKDVDQFKSEVIPKPISLEDLPEDILRNYREKNGDVGKIIYVYPTDRAPMWNGKNLIRFADIIRENTLPTGEVVTASGDSVIFADILRAVIKDGPRSTFFAFVAVCIMIALIFRERRGIFFIVTSLLFGIVWMGGMISALNIKINFFNFIAIPTTFGIAVDYGVNIYQRYKLEGKGSIIKVLQTTGGAVALCSLTTIIGYFTLIIAKNQALVSFGWIAIVGEFTCICAALVFVPAVILWMEGRKKS